MDLRSAPAIALGGMAGAALRWWVHDLWSAGSTSWATLVVNVAGSAVLGWLVAANGSGSGAIARVAGAGFCGSFTTFSAFGLVVVEHFEAGRAGAGVLYAAVSLGLAVAAALAAGLLRHRLRRSFHRAAT
ncbi:MAG: CrcB family protein [Acidimicrobiia bacterium]|nr:CrcB family protein [Acidimicrobiia bacterium]